MTHKILAFMGGTFDPIHNGHLRTALEIQQWLGIERVALMPSKAPVHRLAPGRSAQQRLEMLRIAVVDEPALYADEREVLSSQPSFTVLTLESLRRDLGGEVPICMVVGMDAFLSLPSWDRWTELLQLAHIVVVKRPGWVYKPDEVMRRLTRTHEVTHKDKLMNSPAGHVIFHELTPLAISATQVRELISTGHSPRYLIPDGVWNYIQQQQLYGYLTTE
ncbi:MAG: nicotinate-nucleotide adenylyltransferase [Amphritea sp.]